MRLLPISHVTSFSCFLTCFQRELSYLLQIMVWDFSLPALQWKTMQSWSSLTAILLISFPLPAPSSYPLPGLRTVLPGSTCKQTSPCVIPSLQPRPSNDPSLHMTRDRKFAGNGQDKVQIQLLEGQLAWFVHIISAILKGRVSATSTAENQVFSFCKLA